METPKEKTLRQQSEHGLRVNARIWDRMTDAEKEAHPSLNPKDQKPDR